MADLRQPKSILDHPTLTSTLDLSQPVAVMLVAVLMYFRDTDDPNPFEMVATLIEAMPSGGSWPSPTQPPTSTRRRRAERSPPPSRPGSRWCRAARPRPRGSSPAWTWSTPGVTPVLSWRPDEPPADPKSAYYWAGIARKP